MLTDLRFLVSLDISGVSCISWCGPQVSIKSLLKELREIHRKGTGRRLRARGYGRHQENKALYFIMSKAYVSSQKQKQYVAGTQALCVYVMLSTLMFLWDI